MAEMARQWAVLVSEPLGVLLLYALAWAALTGAMLARMLARQRDRWLAAYLKADADLHQLELAIAAARGDRRTAGAGRDAHGADRRTAGAGHGAHGRDRRHQHQADLRAGGVFVRDAGRR